MIDHNEIENAIGVKTMMTDKMQAAIEAWYAVGINKTPITPDSNGMTLDLAGMVCNRLASLATLEAVVDISGSPRADWIDSKIQTVMSPKKISCLSRALMLGSGIWMPYQAGHKIGVSFVPAVGYYPISEDVDGNLSEVVLVNSVRVSDSVVYHRLQWMHVLDGPESYHGIELDLIEESDVQPPAEYPCVQVVTLAYQSDDYNSLGKRTKLSCRAEWEDILPIAYLSGLDRLPVAYFATPIDNTIEPDSGIGVSSIYPAWAQIAEADKQYSRLAWEYDAGALAIETDGDYLRQTNKSGEAVGKMMLPQGRERLYRTYDTHRITEMSSPFYEVFSPTLRDANYLAGLNQYLRDVESHSGLAFGELSQVSDVEKTAKEIVASKQTMYQTVSAIQAALESTLRDLVAALDFWADAIAGEGDAPAAGKIEESYKWDDSILISREEEMAQWQKEIEMGIRSKAEYRMHFYGESEETANAAVAAASESPDDMLDGIIGTAAGGKGDV